MLRFNGYIPLRRGLLEHLREGRITLREYEVFTILLLWADARSGIATTNGPGLVFLSGNQLSLDYTQKCLASLEKKGYIRRPFYVLGQRCDQRIFIDKYVCTTGPLRLKQLSFAKTKDWENPVYENITEEAGESAGVSTAVHAGVNTSVDAASNNNRNEKNENKQEWMDEGMESSTAGAFDQTGETVVPVSDAGASSPANQADQQLAGRLAQRFLTLLDHPKVHSNSAADWSHKFDLLFRESQLTEDEFLDFLDFALKENDYSVQYLNVAKDPMASLNKNFDSLCLRWRARRKADAAAANSTRKRVAAKAADNRPEYKKDTAQFL